MPTTKYLKKKKEKMNKTTESTEYRTKVRYFLLTSVFILFLSLCLLLLPPSVPFLFPLRVLIIIYHQTHSSSASYPIWLYYSPKKKRIRGESGMLRNHLSGALQSDTSKTRD